MKRRVAAAISAFCAVPILAVGCRQIVGIGDRSAAAQCGLTLPPGECSSCVSSKCCTESEACGAIPVCQSIEACFASCAGDLTCTRNCTYPSPSGALPQYAAIEACISANCPTECALSCGTRPSYGAGDAGEACQECYSNNACTASGMCGESVACLSVVGCALACTTLDCAIQCVDENEAGASLFNAVGNSLSPCDSVCEIGQNLSCVGHVIWPTPTTSANTLTVGVIDPITNAPRPGVDAKLCTKLDPTCTPPLDEQTTDANGQVTLSYNIDPRFGGLDGFVAVSGSGLEPTYFFWNFPLSVQNASLSVIHALSTAELGSVTALAKVSVLPGYGHIAAAAFDCGHSGADGVAISVSPSDANTKVLYATTAPAYTATTGETGPSGIAFIVNVPPGAVTLKVVSVATGMTVSSVLFEVIDGGVDQVFAVPTPQ